MLGKGGKLSFKEFLEEIKLDEKLLGEPERCWTKKNGEGAFKVQIFRISNIKNEKERKSALFDFSKEVYSFSDEKNERKRKDLYKYIGISVFMIAVEASLFTAILLTKRANSLEDIRVLLEVGLYVPMIVSILAGVFLLSSFWITSQTIDVNNIQVLETRLGGHIDYVNLVRPHLQSVEDDEKLSRIPIPPSIHSDYKKLPSDDYKRPQNGLSFQEELKLRVSQKSCEDFLPPPPPCDDFKEISTWTSGVEKPILNSDRGR